MPVRMEAWDKPLGAITPIAIRQVLSVRFDLASVRAYTPPTQEFQEP